MLASRGAAVQAGAVPLTERDKSILEFERTWWAAPGSKEPAIRDRFDLSATRYYQILSELVESPDALTHDPLLIRRLRRVRAERRRQRYEGRTVNERPGR